MKRRHMTVWICRGLRGRSCIVGACLMRSGFPAGYTCFEDAVIHFLIFPAAEKIASISQVVYAWRRNANGITFTSQGTKKAVQAYWIVEELLSSTEDQAAVGRTVLSKSDAAAVELLLCVCGRAYGRRKTGRICLLLSALPKKCGRL